jgi:hypothetical protein
MAQAFAKVSEGINLLALFLCNPALERCRADAPELLRQFAAEYAPAFRGIAPRGAQRDGFLVALDRLSSFGSSGVDLDAPRDVAALRRTIRELLGALGMGLPTVPAAEAAVCELHGAACPVKAGG